MIFPRPEGPGNWNFFTKYHSSKHIEMCLAYSIGFPLFEHISQESQDWEYVVIDQDLFPNF